MSEKRHDLPDFLSPPVTEVALSVQFENIPEFRLAHMGLFWQRFKDRYPLTEDHHSIGRLIEQFKKNAKPPMTMQVAQIPPIRVWFLSRDGSLLVQVQTDRFVRNWRGSGEQYPRYEALRSAFEKDYSIFEEFLNDEGLARPKPIQCEVTYVNHIVAGNGWEHHGEAHKVFEVCSRPVVKPEPEPEDFGFARRYVIPDEHGSPAGRLHVTVSSAHRTRDEKPLFVMTLIARGKLEGEDINGVLAFYDLGRAWIVKRFAALTTVQMHKIWERCNV